MTVTNHTSVTPIASFRDRCGKVCAIVAFLSLLVTTRCLDPYSPPPGLANAKYLVIDGFLTDANGTTVIRLSRTTALGSSEGRIPEKNAIVQIEDDQGGAYTLTESDSGLYSTPPRAINPDRNYRLKIRTAAKKEYASDFVPFKQTPPIDTVTYAIDGDNLRVNVTAHDDNNNTRYYLWKYEETWTYTARYPSSIKFQDGAILQRGSSESLYHCWKTLPSTQILTSSSTKLAQDVISNYPLVIMPLSSEKLQTEYSMLVHQVALTKDAFEYWEQLKKNTENIGTIFGPQPSQVASNIHCTTNPEEPVIGYFSACSMQQKRFFVLTRDLPTSRHATGYESCEMDTLFLDQVPGFKGTSLLIGEISVGMPPVIIGYFQSSFYCVDCRYRGGTTIKPDFWK